MPAPDLEPSAKLWITSACAIPNALTRAAPRHDLLGGAAKTIEATRMAATLLASSWEVHDQTSLRAALVWLRDVGVGGTLRTSTPADGPHPRLAWDLVRLIAVAGWGYLANYISEEEATAFVAPAALRLQESYRSWDDLGRAYLRDTRACDPRAAPNCEMALESLLGDATSPWRTVPWTTPLASPPTARRRGNSALRVGPFLVAMLLSAGLLLAWLNRSSPPQIGRRANAAGLLEDRAAPSRL